MPQPDLPAPLPRRPEPGPELLEALSRRETQRCLRLCEQWGHRRGITDLLRFCREDVTAHQGEAAAAWLQELLNQDRGVAPAGSTAELAQLPLQTSLPGNAAALVTAAVPAPLAAETAVMSPAVPEAPEALAISEEPSTEFSIRMLLPEGSPLAEPSTLAPTGEVSAAESFDPEPLVVTEALAPAALADAIPTAAPHSPQAIRAVAEGEILRATSDAPIPAGPQGDAPSAVPATAPLTAQAPAASDKELAAVFESRAEAAVDAAFAALEETFGTGPQTADGRALQPAAKSAPVPSGPAPQPLDLTTPPQPAPIPPVGTAWPNLSRSALAMTAALPPAGAMQAGSPGAFGSGVEAGANETTPDTALTNQATDVEACSGATDQDPTPAEGSGQQLTTLDPPAAVQGRDATGDASGAAVLLERLRGRLRWERRPRFTRLRAVMRDCVDETLALLRSPGEDGEEEETIFQPSSQAPDHDPFAPLDGPTLTPSVPPSPPTTAAPALTTAARTAATPAQATLVAEESAAIPSWEPLAPAQPAAPQAATPGTDRAARLRRGLLGRRGNAAADRPAPAPSALSDLRVWLPERDDLPRAS